MAESIWTIFEKRKETLREKVYVGGIMIEVPHNPLKEAVESQHGGRATFVQSVPIHEERKGKTVWNGAVQVYDLADSPSGATRAYAWSYGLPDGNRQFVAVLQTPAIAGPREAVRAAMDAQAK